MHISYELQWNCLAEGIFLTTLLESHVIVHLLVYVLNQNPKSLSVFISLIEKEPRKNIRLHYFLQLAGKKGKSLRILLFLFLWICLHDTDHKILNIFVHSLTKKLCLEQEHLSMLRNIVSLQKRSCVFRKEQELPASIDTMLIDMQVYRLLPLCCWGLHSCGTLSSVCRKLFVDVSGQSICPVSRVNHPAWTTWPLNMGLIGCPETLTKNY